MTAPDSRISQANSITLWGSLANFLLTAFKLTAGILGRSTAMIADAIHSLSDFATDIVVVIGLQLAKKPRDSSHNYGHGKFETLVTAIIGIALLAVGAKLGWSAAERIIGFLQGARLEQPGMIALIAAAASIITKELLYRATLRVGKKIGSQAVVANAWHHRTDALSSIGTLVGIGGAILLGEKWYVLDPLAGIIVSALIIKVGFDISKLSLNDLLEAAVDQKTEAKILEIIESVQGAHDPHNLMTRRIGNNVALDVHVRVNPALSIVEAHEVSTGIEKALREGLGQGTYISVHIEPGIKAALRA
ncbi:MAG: cation diffusion facilitator family transporter [Spirochaetes bacterium]|nr:cation diffusion facilitator family transporter [Spirochaetota bacterium]MBU0956543.1 cation diffusion facilitator family transporter [Spirochaetota bacterium]